MVYYDDGTDFVDGSLSRSLPPILFSPRRTVSKNKNSQHDQVENIIIVALYFFYFIINLTVGKLKIGIHTEITSNMTMMKGNPGARNCYDVVRRFGHRYRIVILLMFSFAVVNYFFNTSNNYEQFSNSSNLRSSAASVVVANQQQCTFYLAESSIPHGGLGVFTSKPLRKGSAAQPWPDICVYLTDANSNKGTEIDSHVGIFISRRIAIPITCVVKRKLSQVHVHVVTSFFLSSFLFFFHSYLFTIFPAWKL